MQVSYWKVIQIYFHFLSYLTASGVLYNIFFEYLVGIKVNAFLRDSSNQIGP